MSTGKRQRLLVTMTAEEKAVKADQLAEAFEQIDGVKEAKKDAAAKFKDKEERLTNTARELAECVRSGQEYRMVDVFEVANPEARTWDTVRTDTSEVVSTRPMTDLEIRDLHQGTLPFAREKDNVQ
jgi:predicted glutamine amidotransferase